MLQAPLVRPSPCPFTDPSGRSHDTNSRRKLNACPSWCATDHDAQDSLGTHHSERIAVVNAPGASSDATTVHVYQAASTDGGCSPRISINGEPLNVDAAGLIAQATLRLTILRARASGGGKARRGPRARGC